MLIGSGKAVTIEYTLKDGTGAVLETTTGEEALTYLVGSGLLPAGLEKALEGRGPGERLSVTLTPEEGYGARDESKVQTIPLRQVQVEDKSSVVVGGRYRAWLTDGTHVVVVTERTGNDVAVDGNHPLAGRTLHFAIEVLEVRDATPAEVSHGHIHGHDSDH